MMPGCNATRFRKPFSILFASAVLLFLFCSAASAAQSGTPSSPARDGALPALAAIDTLDKVQPAALNRDTTIMALTAFWIVDRPERFAVSWPPEKTARMLIEKNDDVMPKLFGLWPFDNINAKPDSPGAAR
jgi:hypothetical protein